jgi:ABC-2 type transport system permease protein
MTEKEIKARYKSAVLGFLWILLNPLLQMLIIGIIFRNFIKIPVTNYFLFLFTGLLPWNFFSYSLIKSTPSIVYERALIQKAKFPREAIPLSIIFSNFFHLVISLFLLIGFLILTRQLLLFSSFTRMIFFISSLLWLLAFTSGFSLLSSTLNVKYRDINFFIQALVILWFYATPVIYSLQLLPQVYLPIFQLNPITYPFEMLRFSLITSFLPQSNIFFANAAISLLAIFLGILLFRKENKTFSDWL